MSPPVIVEGAACPVRCAARWSYNLANPHRISRAGHQRVNSCQMPSSPTRLFQRKSPPIRISGLLLILIGGLFLWNNLVGELGIWQLFTRWWPALLILWGLAKLYDHLAAQRTGQAAPSTITGGDIALVLLVVGLAGAAQGVSVIRHHDPGDFGWPPWEQPYSFSEELPAKAIPPGSRITIRTERGDISVRPENTPEIRALVKKTLGGSDERDAENRTRQVNVAIAEANGGYEVRTQNQGGQVRVDLEVHVPKQSNLVAQTARGGLQIAGLAGSVIAEAQRGNVEIRDTGGDVSAQMERGDVHT